MLKLKEEANRWLSGDESARKPPELLTRDVVSAAIRSEVSAGRGSPNNAAYFRYLEVYVMQNISKLSFLQCIIK